VTALLFVLAALAIGAVGIAAGIIVAPILTRASDRLASDGSQEAPPRDDARD
jgi:hypothetical protein